MGAINSGLRFAGAPAQYGLRMMKTFQRAWPPPRCDSSRRRRHAPRLDAYADLRLTIDKFLDHAAWSRDQEIVTANGPCGWPHQLRRTEDAKQLSVWR
jgi:hypothetical protein